MYYNTNNQMLVNNYPKTVTLSNGTIVTGDNFDTSILTNAGYLTVRSDTPTSPENSIEDVSQRVVNIDGDFVDVVRTWIPVPIIIPETISARQVRLWLIDNNIDLNNVVNIINTIEDPILRQKTLVEWEYAPYIERHHPLINTLGSALGLTSEQIDQGFITASQL
jgi:hypothetical protein